MEYLYNYSEDKQHKILNTLGSHWSSNPNVTNDHTYLLFHLDRNKNTEGYSYGIPFREKVKMYVRMYLTIFKDKLKNNVEIYRKKLDIQYSKNIANIIFPLITAPYVARVLNPDSLGLANFASNYAGYFVLVAALGIPNYGIREVSKRRGSKKELSMVFSELFSISILTTVFTSLVFLLTLFLIGQLKHDFIIFLIAGITLFTTPFNIDWFYSGLEDFQYITIRSLVVKTISVICLFLFVRDEADLIIFVLLNALSGCVNQVWNVLVLLKSGIRIRLGLSGIRKHVKPLLLLFSSTIAISLYTTVNVLMLGFASTYDQVSYYNQANNLSRAFLAVVTSLSEIMVPRLSFLKALGDWDNINKLVSKSFSLVSFWQSLLL